MALVWLPREGDRNITPLTYECISASGREHIIFGHPPRTPPGLHIREPLHFGERGIIDVDDVVTQAFLHSTLMGECPRDNDLCIWDVVPSAKAALKNGPYQEKLVALWELYRHSRGGGWGDEDYMDCVGSFDSKGSGWMMKRDPTDFFWLGLSGEFGYAVNTQESDNLFVLGTGYDSHVQFRHLRDLAERGELFNDGPVEFIYPAQRGFYLPVLGVTEIVRANWLDNSVIRMNSDGIQMVKLPEGYYSGDVMRMFRPSEDDLGNVIPPSVDEVMAGLRGIVRSYETRKIVPIQPHLS